MSAVPMAHHDVYPFLALFFTWTTAGTLLGRADGIRDNVSKPEDRGQAALLRTGSDVGMLLGAVGSGALAGDQSQPWQSCATGQPFVCWLVSVVCLFCGWKGADKDREEGIAFRGRNTD